MPDSPSPTQAETPLRVLYVEDQERLREIFVQGLSGLGYQVEAARDGFEGWQKFSRAAFDLVITELDLPNLDGLGFLHLVRQSKRQVRIIVYSSSLNEHKLDQLRELAVDAAIPKESSWIVLCELITAIIRPSR